MWFEWMNGLLVGADRSRFVDLLCLCQRDEDE